MTWVKPVPKRATAMGVKEPPKASNAVKPTLQISAIIRISFCDSSVNIHPQNNDDTKMPM